MPFPSAPSLLLPIACPSHSPSMLPPTPPHYIYPFNLLFVVSLLTFFVVTYFLHFRACVVSLLFFMVTCNVDFSICLCVCVCVSICHDMFVHSLCSRITIACIAPLSITHAGTPSPPLTLALTSTHSSSPLPARPLLTSNTHRHSHAVAFTCSISPPSLAGPTVTPVTVGPARLLSTMIHDTR